MTDGPAELDRPTARLQHALHLGDASPRRLALRELAEATRRAIQESMSTDADEATIEEATALVAEAARLLAAAPHGRPYDGAAEASMTGDLGGHEGWIDQSPIVGPSNPIAPPLRIVSVGDSVEAVGVFGDAYEGPPGCLHGGFVAAAFDDVLGFGLSLVGRPGMTGRLTISYRSPTPLHQELRFRAWVDNVAGRKIHVAGSLHAGDRLCAEAQGLFIAVDPQVFASLMVQRDQRG